MTCRRAETDRRLIKDHRGHHPWRAIGMLASSWRVEFTWDLAPDEMGMTLHDEQRVLIRNGLTAAQRRSSVCHELGHVLRGPVGRARALAEEALVERKTARLLLPSVRRIGHALAWHAADHEKTADELWVDEQLLHVRLSTLARSDRLWLDDQLACVLVDR